MGDIQIRYQTKGDWEVTNTIISGKNLGIIYSIGADFGCILHKIGNAEVIEDLFAKNRDKYLNIRNILGDEFRLLTVSTDNIDQDTVDMIVGCSAYLSRFLTENKLLIPKESK